MAVDVAGMDIHSHATWIRGHLQRGDGEMGSACLGDWGGPLGLMDMLQNYHSHGCISLNILKTNELYTSNGPVVWYVVIKILSPCPN